MSIFQVHERAIEEYRDYIRSFVQVADERLQAFVQAEVLGEGGRLFPEPLLQLSPSYVQDQDVEELARRGLLHPEVAEIFRQPDGSPYRLYRHQVEAIRRAREGRGYVLTSGTGSGKSFSYFIPIADAVLRHPGVRGPLAVVVYPMNALVNSQLQALESLKARYEARTGRPFPLRFARYTGQTPEDERRAVRENPPHLLLTNYVMGEYLLTRPEDRLLVSPPPSQDPFFLVFDELHTYRGRQGADVALLVRRLRARLPEGRPVVHAGTSATLVPRPQAGSQERREAVARFATTPPPGGPRGLPAPPPGPLRGVVLGPGGPAADPPAGGRPPGGGKAPLRLQAPPVPLPDLPRLRQPRGPRSAGVRPRAL